MPKEGSHLLASKWTGTQQSNGFSDLQKEWGHHTQLRALQLPVYQCGLIAKNIDLASGFYLQFSRDPRLNSSRKWWNWLESHAFSVTHWSISPLSRLNWLLLRLAFIQFASETQFGSIRGWWFSGVFRFFGAQETVGSFHRYPQGEFFPIQRLVLQPMLGIETLHELICLWPRRAEAEVRALRFCVLDSWYHWLKATFIGTPSFLMVKTMVSG